MITTGLNIRIGEEEDVEVTVTGDPVPYVPAKINADPDDCYEAEGGYCEDITVVRDDTGEDVTDKLDEMTWKRIEEAMVEAMNNYDDGE